MVVTQYNYLPTKYGIMKVEDIAQDLKEGEVRKVFIELNEESEIRGITTNDLMEVIILGTRLGFTLYAIPFVSVRTFKHTVSKRGLEDLGCFSWVVISTDYYPDVVAGVNLPEVQTRGSIKTPFGLTYDFLLWLGFFYSSAIVSDDRITFLVSRDITELTEYLTDKLFGLKPSAGDALTYTEPELIEFLTLLGILRNRRKDIPLLLRGAGKQLLYTLFRASLSASLTKTLLEKEVVLFLLHELPIAKLYQKLLLALGIVTNLEILNTSTGTYYALYPLGAHSAMKIIRDVGVLKEAYVYDSFNHLSPYNVNRNLNLDFLDIGEAISNTSRGINYLTKLIVNTTFGYSKTVFHNAYENYIIDQIISIQRYVLPTYKLFVSNTKELNCDGFILEFPQEVLAL